MRDGFLHRTGPSTFPGALPADREIHHRRRHLVDQNLAGGRKGRAGETVYRANRRSDSAVEVESNGPRIVPPLVRFLPGTRHDVGEDGQQARAVAYRAVRRKTARTPQLHLAPPEVDSVQ